LKAGIKNKKEEKAASTLPSGCDGIGEKGNFVCEQPGVLEWIAWHQISKVLKRKVMDRATHRKWLMGEEKGKVSRKEVGETTRQISCRGEGAVGPACQWWSTSNKGQEEEDPRTKKKRDEKKKDGSPRHLP